MKRKRSSRFQFVQRIPADVKNSLLGRTLNIPLGTTTVAWRSTTSTQAVALSLGTTDAREARARTLVIRAYLETVWQALRNGEKEVELTHAQCLALAKRFYSNWAEELPNSRTVTAEYNMDTGRMEIVPNSAIPDPAMWASIADAFGRLSDDPVGPMKALVDRLVMEKRIGAITHDSRTMLATALVDLGKAAAIHRQQQYAGDYTPDPKPSQLPEWSNTHRPAAAVSFEDILDGWWAEAEKLGRAEATHMAYGYAIKRLEAYLGHDDASRVTEDNMVDYKAARLASGAAPSTVRSLDLGALRTLFGWAVDNKKLATNPAKDVRSKVAKKIRTRSKGFTEEETRLILTDATNTVMQTRNMHTHLRTRWVPWLCAYTGARVGEIMQLRKQDFSKVGEHWTILITPEAGTVKNKEYRTVVLHEHLIEQGLIEAVQKAREGYLFIGDIKQLRSSNSNMANWVRQRVADPRVAPNHGWRHLFKTIGRQAEIADSVLDAICGHAPGSIGQAYGDVTLETQAEAMASFPRFTLTKA